MKTLLAALIITLTSTPASAVCIAKWSYPAEQLTWVEGFRFYQDGVETGVVGNTALDVSCADAGLIPGPGPVTMTAFRGEDESPPSEPGKFELTAPGLTISIEVN